MVSTGERAWSKLSVTVEGKNMLLRGIKVFSSRNYVVTQLSWLIVSISAEARRVSLSKKHVTGM